MDPLESLKPDDSGHAPCACFNVRRMSRAITQLYDDALKSTGIRSTQFSLLIGIAGIGEEGVGAIAKRLDTDRTTLTRNLKPLLDKGLVQERPTGDARVRGLALTPKGLKALQDALPLWEGAQERVKAGMPSVHFEALPIIADELVALVTGK